MVEILPVEIITKILQLACQDIVCTLESVVRRNPRIKYHVPLARFSEYHRVCWLFNDILNNRIRINGAQGIFVVDITANLSLAVKIAHWDLVRPCK